jgi:glycosyltransferase involved in cell wall biosynthesis
VRILFVASRSPYPARDGGAVLMTTTIDSLASRGHEITVVAPAYEGDPVIERALPPTVRLRLVNARRRPLAAGFLASLFSGRPVSAERHSQPAVTAAVEEILSSEQIDVVHVEQPQALTQAGPAFTRKCPVVLRAQNVETELWRMLADVRPAWRLAAARESRRFARWEGESAARADMTLAITARDAEILQGLAPSARVRVLRMPMPAELPAGDRVLAGEPPVVLLASGAYFPNRDGVSWFLAEIWPVSAGTLPGAQLHVFGGFSKAAAGVRFHEAPEDSRQAFARGAILAVPLRIASGARVRVLEAWARGLPVVATPAAASGLVVQAGRGLLVARDGREFAAALSSLRASTDLTRQLVEDGRAALRHWHDPDRIVEELERAYVEVIGVSAGRTD